MLSTEYDSAITDVEHEMLYFAKNVGFVECRQISRWHDSPDDERGIMSEEVQMGWGNLNIKNNNKRIVKKEMDHKNTTSTNHHSKPLNTN